MRECREDGCGAQKVRKGEEKLGLQDPPRVGPYLQGDADTDSRERGIDGGGVGVGEIDR